jgi:hypothetical protein
MTALSTDEAQGANESLARDLGEADNLLTRYGLSHEGMELRFAGMDEQAALAKIGTRIIELQKTEWLHDIKGEPRNNMAIETASSIKTGGKEWVMRKEKPADREEYRLVFETGDYLEQEHMPTESLTIVVDKNRTVRSVEATDFGPGSVVRAELILTE